MRRRCRGGAEEVHRRCIGGAEGAEGGAYLEGGGERATACVGAYQLELGPHPLAEEPVGGVGVRVLLSPLGSSAALTLSSYLLTNYSPLAAAAGCVEARAVPLPQRRAW
eukprot:scaffold62697_cov57-Phaeocystis_antarctica.AAC.7